MRIGPYEVLERVGVGGMGSVYRVRDTRSGEVYALKELNHPGEATRQRFLREAEALHALDHPHVVRCVAVGSEDENPYLVMDYVEGESFQAQLGRRGRLPVHEVLDVGCALASALEAVHAQDLLHRDLKPDNVLLSRDGRVLLADFGLVKRDRPGVSKVESLTQPGSALGTPGYWAPEQARGQLARIGPPSDVYGLAATLYGLLTGHPPRDGATLVELVQALDQPVAPLRHATPDAPPALEALLARALADDPEARPTLEAFAAELEALRRAHGGATSTVAGLPQAEAAQEGWGWAVGALGLLVLLGAFAVWILRPPPAPPTLSVTAPAAGAVLAGDGFVDVVGDVRFPEGWVEVAVGEVRVRLEAPGGAFRLRCPASAGPNALSVVASGAGGAQGEPTQVPFHYTFAPTWFLELPPKERARLPLPEGVGFGDEPGDYTHALDGSRLRWIPGGTFLMGSEDETLATYPRHEVALPGFYLGRCEVTWAQYQRYLEATGAQPLTPRVDIRPYGYRDAEPFTPGPTHPVVGVSQLEAQAYCAWARLRLPSESEFEYASGGRSGAQYPWGDAPPDATRLNAGDQSAPWEYSLEAITDDRAAKAPWEDGYPYSSPAGAFPAGASPEGVLDLAGNAGEWVADGWNPNYVGAPADGRPRGPSADGRGVIRGGSFASPTRYARRIERDRATASVHMDTRGFRVARDGQ